MNPKAIGEISEAVVLAHLIKAGRSVSIPFGNNQRYDLLIDEGESIVRAQVKTGKLRNGIVTFRACSTNGFTGAHRSYVGSVDVFLVYCPQNLTMTTLRIDEPRGGPTSTLRWARDYLI